MVGRTLTVLPADANEIISRAPAAGVHCQNSSLPCCDVGKVLCVTRPSAGHMALVSHPQGELTLCGDPGLQQEKELFTPQMQTDNFL